MSNTPSNSPETTSYQATDHVRQQARLVAKYQRWVIFALLGNIVANILAFATVRQALPVRLIAIVLSLAVVVFAMVAIFLLAKEIIGTAVGVLCAILMFVPFISLIMLLVVNQKATSYLQKNGVHVGFLGVDPNSI